MTDLQALLQTLSRHPGEPEALAQISAAYAAEGRWEELLRVYEENAFRAEPEQAPALWRRAAELCLNELGSVPRAEAYLTRAIEMAPADLESLRALREIHFARGEWDRGAEVWERELARTSDLAAKLAGLVALAGLWRERLRRDDRALAVLRQAQRADRAHPPIYAAMAEIYLAQERLDQAQTAMLTELEIGGPTDELLRRLTELAARLLARPKLHELAAGTLAAVLGHLPEDRDALALQQELAAFREGWAGKVAELTQDAVAAGADRERAAEAWLRVAEVQLVYGQQPDAALVALDKAMAARPGFPGGLRLLEEIYAAEDRFEDLALKLEMMAAYAREPQIAVELYLKAAMHYAVRLDNPEASAGIYQRVLQLEPSNKVASNALAEFYRERKRFTEAVRVLAAWAERATQVADKVAAHYACCRILEEEVGDPASARPHYEAILALDPENQAAAGALEVVFRAAGDHAALAKALHGKLAGLAGDGRQPVLAELGELYAGPLAQPAEALVCFGELYQLAPSAKLRERLEELAAAAGAFAELVKVLEGGLERITDDGDRVQALHSLAALYEGAREAPLEALRVHRRILALRPDDEAARQAVDRLMQAAAQSTDKITFYREQADAASSPAERASILGKLAVELVQTSKDYVRAIDVYREILRLTPADSDALEALLGLYRRDNRWAEVVDVLLTKVEKESDAKARLALQLELGRILETRLGEVDRAVDWYLEALRGDAQQRDALAGLERLLNRSKRVVAVAEVLQPRYVAASQWDRVAAMLEIRITAATDATRRAELLRDLGGVLETRLQKPTEALNALLRAFQAHPVDAELKLDLERLAGKLQQTGAVTRAYRAAAAAVEGPAQTELWLRAAALAERGDDAAGAVADYLRVLASVGDVDHQVTDGLRRLLKAGLAGDALREIGRTTAGGLDTTRAEDYWRQLARFYERDMNDTQSAIAAWREVLTAHNADPEATAELDRLYASGAEPAQLVEHLREKLSQASDDVSRAALGGQIAEVLAERMGDVGAAITELGQVAELAPGQRLVWQRLYELNLKAGQAHEAANALYRELALLPEGDERQSRLVLYAGVVGRQLGDLPTALQALQGVLAADPKNGGAIALLGELRPAATDPELAAQLADLLIAATQATGDFPAAIALLGERAAATADPLARVGLRKQAAALLLEKQNDAPGAFAELEQAFHDAPTDADLRDRLERLAEAANAWERLAQAYSAALGVLTDAEVQKALRRKLAEILDKRLGRGDEAIEHLRAATGGTLPEDLASLEAMERLLRQQSRPSELADVLYAIASRLPDSAKERKLNLLIELGDLCQVSLADKPRAVDAYRAAIELEAKEERALRPIATLLEELGRTPELSAVLETLVAKGAQNPHLLDDLLHLAEVMVALEKPEEAVKHFRAVLLKRREHPPAIEGLEALLLSAPNKQEIAQILEPIYTAKQDHEKLAMVLEARLEGTSDKVQRKGLLRRIGDIYENRLNKKDLAFSMARRSLAEDPADMGVRMWIEKLAGETGALAPLAEAYVEESRTAPPQLSLQFHRRAAAIYHEKLNDPPSAVREYAAILELEARDEKALTGLETIHRATENWAELIALLRRRVELSAGLERKREYLIEIATLQADRLSDLEAAVATQREILAISPDDLPAFGQLEQLLARMGNWEELGRVYVAEIQRLAEKRSRDVVARRLEYQYRRGRILDEQFSEHAAAAEIFTTILDEVPNHASTVAYLEARAQQGMAEAFALLKRVYEQQSEWQKLVALFELELKFTPETERRRPLLVAMAEVFDGQLKVGDMAFQALARAHQEDRTNREIVERLEELSGRFNFWPHLVALLGVDVDAIPDPAVRQYLWRRLGSISGEQLGDVQTAVRYFQAALQHDPNDRDALAALDGILEKNQMWAALAELLERRIDLATEPGVKSTLLERLAEVWAEKLMDAEAALRCHQQILEIDPDHPISLKSMQKLYAEVQDWDALAKNLQRQAEVLTEPEDQIRIHAAAGELYAEELNDNNGAIEHWQKVVALAPAHDDANVALSVLLTSEERWEELAVLLRQQLAHTPDPEAKAEINQRLGVVLGDKLGRTDDALSTWLEVLQTDEKNVEAMRALLGLYTERAMWEEFVGIARRLIPRVDPADAKDLRYQLARALGENLGQREEAIKLAREVRATEPHTAEQMTRLAELLKNIEAFDEAVIALEKAAPLEEDPAVKVALYYEAAELHASRLGKPNDARGDYEAIRVVQPEDGDAHAALAEIYRNTSDWRKLVALHEEFVPHADSAARIQVLTEIRDVHDQKLGEKELAFIAACRVYKENPVDQAAADALERLGVETDGAEEVVAVLEDELDNIVDSDAKIETFRRIARVQAEQLKDTPAAEAALNRILTLSPTDLAALDALANLGASEERPDKQVAALERKLESVAEESQRKSVLFEIARIWEEQIVEIDEAIGAFQRVLEIDGGDPTALDNLVRIYEKEARWPELAHTLTRKVELCQDPGENIGLRMRVAALCESDLEDQEAAIQWYRGVLDFDAGHAGALSALERLYTGGERWSELIQTFELQISATAAAEEQIAILAKMATIYEEKFESARDAAACYERVFQIDAKHVAGLRHLERLLRTLGEWPRLIEVLQHHITLASDATEITELYLQIGEVYYKELSQVDKAEQIYNAARDFNPNSAAALHALGQLYERSGNWFQSLDMLQKEVDALGQSEAALPVLLRIGKINEDMLMDLGAAQAAYHRALEIDPNYGPALQALKEIARAAEDWDSYAEHLITEAEASSDADDKTELFYEAAKFYNDVRQDEQSAIRYFQRALEITPAHFESARALAEIFFRNEMWQEAGDLYEIVVSKLDKGADAKDFCQKNYRLGYINEKLGQAEAALAYYREAFEADATYLPGLEGLGQALLAAQEWEEAHKVFSAILVHHRDSLTESEIVDVQYQLGDICLRQEQPDRGYKQFEKALEIDPDHGPSLQALARLDEQMENWEGAYERLSRLAESVSAAERGEVLLGLSDIARNKLQDPRRALEALERARRMGHPPVEVLIQLAEAYLEAHQPQKAVEVLEQGAGVAADPDTLSDVNFRLGVVYQTEIKHEPLAVQKFNAALDAQPTNIKAFEAIEKILAARQEWGLLEQNYRAMIARAKDLSAQVRLVLWRNLAELYRRVLKHVDNAIMAYEVIQKLEPGKPGDVALLAELYAEKPEHRAKAVEMLHEVLKAADNPVPVIKKLRRLYHALRQFDAVYVMCGALTFLKEVDAEERKIFEYLAQGVPAKASQRLLEDHWQMILHPDLANAPGTLANWLYRSAPDLFTRPAKDLDLKKKDQIDVRSSDLYFANMMRYVGKLLNIQSVDLFRKSGSMEPLHLMPAQPPALVAGENHEIFRGGAQKSVLFHIGRQLAYARPELFLARIYPGDELRDLLLGLCVVYNRALQHNGDPREVLRWASAFERLPPPVLKRLQPLARTAFTEIVQGRGLEQYTAAVELTAARSGLLACGDLFAAVQGISEGGHGASGVPTRLRVKELVLYAVSREHLQLRQVAGAALAAEAQQQAQAPA